MITSDALPRSNEGFDGSGKKEQKENLLSLSRTKDLLMTIEQLQSDALNQLS
jgi:hypothetical protein